MFKNIAGIFISLVFIFLSEHNYCRSLWPLQIAVANSIVFKIKRVYFLSDVFVFIFYKTANHCGFIVLAYCWFCLGVSICLYECK